jgi:hypothetical protein
MGQKNSCLRFFGRPRKREKKQLKHSARPRAITQGFSEVNLEDLHTDHNQPVNPPIGNVRVDPIQESLGIFQKHIEDEEHKKAHLEVLLQRALFADNQTVAAELSVQVVLKQRTVVRWQRQLQSMTFQTDDIQQGQVERDVTNMWYKAIKDMNVTPENIDQRAEEAEVQVTEILEAKDALEQEKRVREEIYNPLRTQESDEDLQAEAKNFLLQFVNKQKLEQLPAVPMHSLANTRPSSLMSGSVPLPGKHLLIPESTRSDHYADLQ